MSNLKVIGITDETTTCECCGKTNLKKTVVLEARDGGEFRFGVDCAARALLGKKSSSNSKIIIRRAQAVGHLRALLAKGIDPVEACRRVENFYAMGFHVYARREIIVNGGWFTLPI